MVCGLTFQFVCLSLSRSNGAHVYVCNIFLCFFSVEKCSSHIIKKVYLEEIPQQKQAFLLIWSWVHWDEFVFFLLPTTAIHVACSSIGFYWSRNEKQIEEVIVTDEELLSNKLNDTRHTAHNQMVMIYFDSMLFCGGMDCVNAVINASCCWCDVKSHRLDISRWSILCAGSLTISLGATHLRAGASTDMGFYEPRYRNEHNFIAVAKTRAFANLFTTLKF